MQVSPAVKPNGKKIAGVQEYYKNYESSRQESRNMIVSQKRN